MPPLKLSVRVVVRRSDQGDMIYAERRGDLINTNDCWIAPTALQARQILLREAGFLGQLFLGQSLLLSDAAHILADQLPHIHAAVLTGALARVYPL